MRQARGRFDVADGFADPDRCDELTDVHHQFGLLLADALDAIAVEYPHVLAALEELRRLHFAVTMHDNAEVDKKQQDAEKDEEDDQVG